MKKQLQLLQTYFVVTYALCVDITEGYQSGAPPSQCVDGFPFHGVAPQKSVAPYTITLSSDTYNPGEVIRVTLQASSTYFKGFSIHVRRSEHGADSAVGKFDSYDVLYVQGYSVNAVNGIDVNCLTHKGSIKKQRLEFSFYTPYPSQGNLAVIVTFVKEETVYWARVTKYLTTSIAPATSSLSPTVETTLEIPKFETCGTTRGCFLYPRDCDGLDCRYALSYGLDTNGDKMEFEAMGTAPDFISLGFSADDKMGTDETITCISSNKHTTVQHGFNQGHCNQRKPLSQLSDLAVTRSGDKIFCKWKRPLVANLLSWANMSCKDGDRYNEGTKNFVFSFTSVQYRLFFARGSVFQDTDVIKQHDQLPIVSEDTINFLQTKIHYGWQLPPYIKAHGALAITAWLAMIAFAVITARHFKRPLSRLLCQRKMWFQIHQIFISLGIIIMAGSLAVLFGFLRDFKLEVYRMSHGIIGLIACLLVLLQALVAPCRPSPTKIKLRQVWLGSHRALAILALIAACVAILMGINMEPIDVWLRERLTIIICVWIGYLLIWAAVLELLKSKIKPPDESQAVSEVDQKSVAEESNSMKPDNNGYYGNYPYYVIYVMLLLGATVLFLLSLAYLGMA